MCKITTGNWAVKMVWLYIYQSDQWKKRLPMRQLNPELDFCHQRYQTIIQNLIFFEKLPVPMGSAHDFALCNRYRQFIVKSIGEIPKGTEFGGLQNEKIQETTEDHLSVQYCECWLNWEILKTTKTSRERLMTKKRYRLKKFRNFFGKKLIFAVILLCMITTGIRAINKV